MLKYVIFGSLRFNPYTPIANMNPPSTLEITFVVEGSVSIVELEDEVMIDFSRVYNALLENRMRTMMITTIDTKPPVAVVNYDCLLNFIN
jgi:hypothetical protein